MTPRGQVALGGAALVVVATALGVFAAGGRGAAIALSSTLSIEVLLLLARDFSAPRRVHRPRARRPALPTPVGATTQRQLAAIQMATRGPRWADTELRPQLRRILDALPVSRRPAPEGDVGADLLAWFIDPDRQVRGHDEGEGLSLREIEAMIRRLEDLA
jgi:hypothetical protein